MAFEDIKVIDPYVEKGWTAKLKLTLATPTEVDAFEANLNVSMPVSLVETLMVFDDALASLRERRSTGQ